MKKFTVFFLTIVLLLVSTPSAFATKPDAQTSIVMAINNETLLVNGVQTQATAPVLVFGRTYVDLYDVAPFLNMEIQWVEDSVGFFKVTSKGTTFDFTPIFQWDHLLTQPRRFFVKDSRIMVSLRELVDMAGVTLTYQDGLITIGNPDYSYQELYREVDTHHQDNYVYEAYPFSAEYVVNPYQAYSYETMLANTEELKRIYPDLIRTSSIGTSVEGRDLLLIEFGKGDTKIFVCGTHHAREYIATTYLMYAIDRYALAYKTNSMWGKYNPKEILDQITFCIVPMINPDGVNLVQNGIDATKNPEDVAALEIYEGSMYGYSAWKANIRGVDLNWNYDKDWSLTKNKNPRGSSGFTGDCPYTEPETIAVSDYVDTHPFDAYLSFHTQGEIFYWADSKADPTYVQDAIKKDTGFTGYVDYGTGIGGSFFDYVYRNFDKPTITVELCPYVGNYPYPDSKFDTVWDPTKNVLLVVGNEILYHNSLK